MPKSMTGYGRSEGHHNGTLIRVEIRSVNHRFLEVAVRIPREFLSLEDSIKKEVQSVFHRGRLDVYITMESDGSTSPQTEINWPFVEQFIQSIQQVKNKFHLEGNLTVSDIVQIPELIIELEPEINIEQYREPLLDHVRQATRVLEEMRSKEGAELGKDLQARIGRIEHYIERIREQAPKVVLQYRQKIHERLKQFLQDVDIDEGRLLTEVALFADKSDISEELTRLHSHCKQFIHTLTHASPVGRKLDFLVQEMNREINTVAAKSNDLLISQNVIEVKSELEKIREQIQNIE